MIAAKIKTVAGINTTSFQGIDDASFVWKWHRKEGAENTKARRYLPKLRETCDEEVKLKKNCKVMLVANLSGTLVNGAVGEVVDFLCRSEFGSRTALGLVGGEMKQK